MMTLEKVNRLLLEMQKGLTAYLINETNSAFFCKVTLTRSDKHLAQRILERSVHPERVIQKIDATLKLLIKKKLCYLLYLTTFYGDSKRYLVTIKQHHNERKEAFGFNVYFDRNEDTKQVKLEIKVRTYVSNHHERFEKDQEIFRVE